LLKLTYSESPIPISSQPLGFQSEFIKHGTIGLSFFLAYLNSSLQFFESWYFWVRKQTTTDEFSTAAASLKGK